MHAKIEPITYSQYNFFIRLRLLKRLNPRSRIGCQFILVCSNHALVSSFTKRLKVFKEDDEPWVTFALFWSMVEDGEPEVGESSNNSPEIQRRSPKKDWICRINIDVEDIEMK